MRSLVCLTAICLLAALPAVAEPHGVETAQPNGLDNVPRPTARPNGTADNLPEPTPPGFHSPRTLPQPDQDGAHVPLNEHPWRAGYWRHGGHNGRFGWWWIAGSEWFFYNSPIYPFPDIYGPPGAQKGLWYWCDVYRDYYPYVTRCPSGWRLLPAS